MTDGVSNVTGIIPPLLGLYVAGAAIKMTKDALSDKKSRPHSERYGYEHKKGKHKHNSMHSFWWDD